jgi:transcriptional regulator GlxA family with amidase domain
MDIGRHERRDRSRAGAGGEGSGPGNRTCGRKNSGGLITVVRAGKSQFSTLLDLDAQSDRLQTALTYAKEHLSNPLLVDALANAACLCPRQFSRLFKEETGHSPARAIEWLRVESARLMMESGRFSAEEIARKNGFGNRERMRRSFVRAFGQSPQTIQRTVSA